MSFNKQLLKATEQLSRSPSLRGIHAMCVDMGLKMHLEVRGLDAPEQGEDLTNIAGLEVGKRREVGEKLSLAYDFAIAMNIDLPENGRVKAYGWKKSGSDTYVIDSQNELPDYYSKYVPAAKRGLTVLFPVNWAGNIDPGSIVTVHKTSMKRKEPEDYSPHPFLSGITQNFFYTVTPVETDIASEIKDHLAIIRDIGETRFRNKASMEMQLDLARRTSNAFDF